MSIELSQRGIKLATFAREIRIFTFALISVAALHAQAARAQTLSNSSLNAKYFFVQLLITADSNTGLPITVSNLGGSITFNGAGAYTFSGNLGANETAAGSASGSGSYNVLSDGSVTLTNPIRKDLNVNGRMSADQQVLLGSATEDTKDYTGDLFVAVKAPTAGMSNAAVNGSYVGSTMALPNGGIQTLSSSFVSLVANGSGQFTSVSVTGHEADRFDMNMVQTPTGASYSISADGTGTANFGSSAASSLLNGGKSIFVSADGNYLLGFSTAAGGRDIFLATKIFSTTASASNASLNGRYWIAELDYDDFQNSLSSASGAFTSFGNQSNLLSERRNGAFSYTSLYSDQINPGSSGQFSRTPETGLVNMALGAPSSSGKSAAPNAMAGAQIDLPGFQTTYYGVFFAVQAPSFSGVPGSVFLNPSGVVSVASSAPSPNAIAPGDIVSLYGAGLAPATNEPDVVPLKTADQGVSVTVNGIAAPLYFISAAQINIQIPFQASGSSAAVQVTNNGQQSNVVTVALSPGDPAIFTWADAASSYHAAALHANYSLVTSANPAKRGEPIQFFVSGLGSLNPAVASGAANPSSPPASTPDKFVSILFDGESAATFSSVIFAGGAPTFVGLDQINAVVPLDATTGPSVPVQLQTSWGYSDFTNLAIQ